MGVLPFFHGFGFLTNLTAIIRGLKIAVIKRFEEKLFLKSIQDFKITTLNLAPPLVVLLTKSPLVENYDLSSVKDLISGAAPLSKATEETLFKRYGMVLCHCEFLEIRNPLLYLKNIYFLSKRHF